MALNTFSDLVHEARTEIERDGQTAGLPDDPTPLRHGGTGANAHAAGVAASYNGLIAVWSELTRQAAAVRDTRGDQQGLLEFERHELPR